MSSILRSRLRLQLACGVAVAVAVASEVATLGLLGVSGWFLASCALAGMMLAPGFSYVVPSAMVRALALVRIGGGWTSRVLLHRVALMRRTTLRGAAIESLAASGRSQVQPGEALENVLSDSDAVGDLVVRVLAPRTIAWCCAGLVIAVATVVRPATGIVLAGGCAMVAALAATAGRAGGESGRARLRGSVIAAMDDWPELVSLGAAGALRDQLRKELADAERSSVSFEPLKTTAVVGAAAVTIGLVLATLVLPGSVRAPELALVGVLAVVVLDLIAGTAATAAAAARGRDAAARLRVLDAGGEDLTPGLNGLHTTPDDSSRDTVVVGLGSVPVGPGATVVITGPTGSGKTTALRHIAERLGERAVYVPVDSHLFRATVLDNLRIGQPGLDRTAAVSLLELVELDASLTVGTMIGPDRRLSGGERRRLTIARAAAANPSVLLIDEPSAGVEPAQGRRILQRVREALPATAIIVAQHADDLACPHDSVDVHALR